VKLVRLFSFEYSRYVIWAEILDGEFKGKVVDLGGFTSGDPNRKGSLVLYSKFLEPVQ
jgi:ABC-type Fe3+ transport system substrate-binding protein